MGARPPTKIHLRLKGPYLVANFRGDVYTCQNLISEELEDYHVTRFRYDDRFVDPRDVTLRDVDEYYVEQILAHSGNLFKLKTLQSMLSGVELMSLPIHGSRGRICVKRRNFIAI